MAPLRTQDDRGLSESTGVAVLILMTVLGTLSVGMSVFLINEEDDTELGTSFDFQHQGNLELLLIFYDDGEALRAGSLYVDGPANNVSWAELAGMDADGSVTPGGDPIRVGENTPYGSSVAEEAYFEIVYTPEEGEQMVLATYGDPENDGGSGTDDGEPGGGEPGGGQP